MFSGLIFIRPFLFRKGLLVYSIFIINVFNTQWMTNKSKIVISNWLNEYGDELYSWAFYKTSNKEIAEDLVQETFISAFSNYDKFQEKSAPKTWLHSILKNKIIDHYRKKSKEFTISFEEYYNPVKESNSLFNENNRWFDDSGISTQNWLDNPEFNTILSKCKNKLPKNWQFIIQAKYFLDKDSKQICQELEISTSNYWQIMHRAKLLLKKCIEINWVK